MWPVLCHQAHSLQSGLIWKLEAGLQQVLTQSWRRSCTSQAGTSQPAILGQKMAFSSQGLKGVPASLMMSSCQRSGLLSHMMHTRSNASLADRLPPSLQQAISLHAGALWQRHKTKVYLGTSVLAVWLVWRITFGIATSFWTVTQTMADWGFMALAIAAVAAGAQYARWYFGLNPSSAYRQAMLHLNTSPAVLEVMGAPLIGSNLHASIQTGGNLYLSRKSIFRPKISSRRLQMLFPLRGSERDGLVSMEVKKKQGRHVFKMLAVDVRPIPGSPGAAAAGARIFVEGNQAVYDKSGALGALRDPFLKALQFQKEADRDEEQEEDEEVARQQAVKAKQEAAAKQAAAAAPVTTTTTKTAVKTADKPSTPGPAAAKADTAVPLKATPEPASGASGWSLRTLMFGSGSGSGAEQGRS